jgi:alpha-tubulin suppressor-like RCC1 family protein
MSFLPIVGRELRGAARRRGTYWVRAIVAGIAILIGTLIFLAKLGTPAAQSGRAIFQGLSGLLLLYGLASGRGLTVDCLSVEKREGTLGLLFLTDLKGYDVVLGKLAATSLNGFYALLAVLPVLAFSMLLGAVGNAEFWRMVLVLADTFLFSLAVGIFCSALSRDARRASAANFALLLLFVGVFPAMAGLTGYFLPGHPLILQWFYTCPAFPFYLSSDANYKLYTEDFWRSVGAIHLLTWLLVMLASWIVPRTWQDRPLRREKAGWRGLWRAWNYGPVAARAAYRKRMLDVNAFYWLTARARLKPVHVWTFLGFIACWWTVCLLRAGDVWWGGGVVIIMALIINSTLKLWVILEAGQQLVEDQSMGTMELLLPTRLDARDILRGQWLALRRQFLRPLMVVIVAELLLAWIAIKHEGSDPQLVYMVLAGVVMLVADAFALAWVSMRQALTSRSASRAAISTAARVLILPWGGYGAVQLVIGVWNTLWPEQGWYPEWRFDLGLWFGLGMVADLFFGLVARHQLLSGFRRLAMHRFESKPSRLAQWSSSPAAGETLSATHTVSANAAAPPLRVKRWKRKALACGVILAVVAGVVLTRRKPDVKYPPPVILTITQSNMPLQITAGQQTLILLPDGSLWRWGWMSTGWQSGHEIPEPFDARHDWVQVSGSYYRGLGVHRDGSLSAWGDFRFANSGLPFQPASRPAPWEPAHDWVSVAGSGTHSLAIRKDGSLWAWGNNSVNQLGNGPGPNQTNAVQVGTNRDWAAVRSWGRSSIGLRTDGSLWVWGQSLSFIGGITRVNQVAVPTRLCQETNWMDLETPYAWLVLAVNSTGELWQLPIGSPNPEAGIASTGRLIMKNSGPNRLAVAGTGGLGAMYQVHADGTLWEMDLVGSLPAFAVGGMSRRVGSRSDWVSIWSGAGTVLGETADGTIWTWGTDWSQKPKTPFSARLRMLQDRIARTFNSSATTSGVGAVPVYLEEPRPLMRLIMTGGTQSTNAAHAANSK